MATSKLDAGREVKEEHKPKVEVKLTRTQILRQKMTHKSTTASTESEGKNKMAVSSATGNKSKMTVLETTKIQRKSKSATLLSSDVKESEHTRNDEHHVKESEKGDTSGNNKRKTTKTVTIRDSLSPRIKRRELSSSFKSSPVLSPRASAKPVHKSHSHDAIHTTVDDVHFTRQAKSGTVSSMAHLSDSRSSIASDVSMDSVGSESTRHGLFKSICVPAQIVTDRLYTPTNISEKREFLKRKKWLLPDPQHRPRKNRQAFSKKTPEKDINLVKASSTDDIRDSFHGKALSTEDVPDACCETLSAADISDVCYEYDWLNRSARSDTDLTTTRSLEKKSLARKNRRHSDPLGYKIDPLVVDYDQVIDDGFSRNGVFFLREYFRQDLDWLTIHIDSYLSRRNLLPAYPAATNEEWYLTETRAVVSKPTEQEDVSKIREQEDLTDVSAVADETKVVVDSVNSVANVGGSHGVVQVSTDVIETEEIETLENLPQMSDAWTETWPQIIMCDVATMTVRAQMCSRTTSTEPMYCDQQTSTDDIGSLRIKCEQGTSTADIFDGANSESPTPIASPIDTDVESSSAYGSYESGNLRKQLHDRGSMPMGKSEGFSQTDSEFGLKLQDDGSGTTVKTKAGLTEEDTTRIQSELNRLARERIEIIELFALNVGSLTPTFTEELLESKLNYSIGQTDQLLALLENAWDFEDVATSTPRGSVCMITQEIIQQSRTELEHSKKVIRLCIDEVREINRGGSRHSNFHEEIKRMKRRAEIEAFKLERMWEQLLYERTKKRKPVSELADQTQCQNIEHSYTCADPAYSTFEQHASYLSNLRNRSMLATSQEDIHRANTSSTMEMQRDVRNDSVDSYLGMPGYLTPHEHQDHLMELRRLLITEHDRPPGTSRSKSMSPTRPVAGVNDTYNHRLCSSSSRLTNVSSAGYPGIVTSTTRFGHVYPSNPAYSSYSSRSSKIQPASDRYRSTSQTSRSTLYSTPWSTHRDPVPTTSSYDKYKLYTGKYQTTIT
ncbi:uncharacterized protein LOC121372086 [Gigantopelta aegis]|uniref:uncharacterized protein LOC121372086 n=1 Tax=Gigantopelta aegis TaxID=1735272 RepID=UPI001B88CFB3|nr:uncharacterized protein LOC121372086 [Gigantopelta aegis]